MRRTAEGKARVARGLLVPLRSSSDLRKRNSEIKLLILVVIYPAERADKEDYAKHLSLRRLTCDDACDNPGFT